MAVLVLSSKLGIWLWICRNKYETRWHLGVGWGKGTRHGPCIGLKYRTLCVSSSKISNLFARDEMDEITQGLISVMKRELPRHPPTFDNLYEYFISRSRKNLHVVLCFSPVSFYCIYFYVGGITSLHVLHSPFLMRWFAQKQTLVTLK